jgi:hypothetical protein
MLVFHLGPNTPGVPDGDFIWFISWYESTDWDGWGDGVGLHKDGELYFFNLGHCSCYGPLDSGIEHACSMSPHDLLTTNDLHAPDLRPEVMAKVRELLGAQQ